MCGEIFVKISSKKNFDEFAYDIFKMLNIDKFEKRESGNYIDEVYYKTEVIGVEIKIAIADDSRFPEYQFWIMLNVKMEEPQKTEFRNILTDFIAHQIVKRGYILAVPQNVYENSGKFIYTLKDNEVIIQNED